MLRGSEEDIQELQRCSRTAAADAAQLSLLLRRACGLLGGPCHQQADNIVGVLVAVNASRLLSTAWPVLFQNLRDSSDVRVKLAILRHFACVADRIVVEQRANAFRVFAVETRALLASPDVLIDNSFLRSFTLTLDALGFSAEAEWCHELLDVATHHLRGGTRPDVLRAAANAAVAVVGSTTACGTVESFLVQAEHELTDFAFALVLDSSISFFAKRARVAKNCAGSVPLELVRRLISDAMAAIFPPQTKDNPDEKALATKTSTLPSVLSAYSKLKEIQPSRWSVSREPDICRRVLQLLKEKSTKKIYITPFLRFLQATHVRWWSKRKPVWTLATTADPLTRNEAFSALANCARDISSAEAAKTAGQLLPLFTQFYQQNCISTISGIMKLLTVTVPKMGDAPAHQEELCQRLFSTHLQGFRVGSKVSRNAAVQTLFLGFVGAVPSVAVSASLLAYVKGCLRDDNEAVRRMAMETLVLSWSRHFLLNELDFTQTPLRAVDFFEGSFRQHDNFAGERRAEVRGYELINNFTIIFDFLLKQLVEQRLYASDAEFSQNTNVSCRNLACFFDLTSRDAVSAVWGCGQVLAANRTDYLKAFLGDFLVTAQISSICTLSHLITLSTYLLDHSSSHADCFDVFDHKDAVNWVYNVLFLCCECIDPNALSPPRYEECLYFCKVQLPQQLVKMVRHAAEASLTNKQPLPETEFSRFIDDNLVFLGSLLVAGANSPVFIGHLRNLYGQLIVCVDILAGSNPQPSLRLLHTVEKVLFGTVDTRNRHRYETDYPRFITTANCVLTRVLQLDLTEVGEGVFQFATSVVEADVAVGKGAFYDTLDPGSSLLEAAVRLLEWSGGYLMGSSTHESALIFLCSLSCSPQHRSLVRARCTTRVLDTAKATIADLTALYGAKSFEGCRILIVGLEDTLRGGDGEDPENQDRDAGAKSGFAWLTEFKFAEIDPEPAYFFDLLERFGKAFSGYSLGDLERELAKHDALPSWATNPYLGLCVAAVDSRAIPTVFEGMLSPAWQRTFPPFLREVFIGLLASVPDDVQLPCVVIPTDCSFSPETEQLTAAYRWGVSRVSPIAEAAAASPPTHLDKPGALRSKSAEGVSTSGSESAPSRSVSVRGGSDAVSFALKQMRTGICALSSAPSQLVTENALDKTTLRDIFECCQAPEAWELLNILLEEDHLSLLDAECVVAVARSLVTRNRCDAGKPNRHVESDDEGKLCEHFVRLLGDEGGGEQEQTLALRYSILYVLWHVHAARDEADGTAMPNALLKTVALCCGAPVSVSSEHALAAFIRRRFMTMPWASPHTHTDWDDSFLWLAAQFCRRALWEDLDAAESRENSALPDIGPSEEETLAKLRFRCLAAHTVGVPADLWDAACAQHVPLLLQYGHSSNPDHSSDEQRAALWLVSSLVLHHPCAQNEVGGPVLHTSFTDDLTCYNDFPLHSLEAPASTATRRLGVQAIMPFYKRRCAADRDRVTTGSGNRHLGSLLLPLGPTSNRPQSEDRERTQAQTTSLLLSSVIETLLDELLVGGAHKLPPSCFLDVMSAVALLSAGNTNYVRFTLAPPGSRVRAKTLRLAQDWFVWFAADWLADTRLDAPASPQEKNPPQSVLRRHVGLLPGSTASLEFYDLVGITAASTILACFSPSLDAPSSLSLPPPSLPPLPPAAAAAAKAPPVASAPALSSGTASVSPPPPPDIVTVIELMLSSDLFLYSTALSSVVVLVSSSRREEVAALAVALSHRVGEDLSCGRWGLLSVPFALTQLLRASCAVLTMVPEEKVSTKICEGVWGGVIQRPWGPTVTMYGHYVVQCLMHITPSGEGKLQRQWEMLRMLVMSARPTPNANIAAPPLPVPPLCSTGLHVAGLAQRNPMAPHRALPRRVSLSWSEDARAAAGLPDEHAPAVQRLKSRFLDLQELITRAALIHRSISRAASSADSVAEVERDRSGVQVADLIQATVFPTAAAATSTACPAPPICAEMLLCLEVLTESVLPTRDAFFSAINRLDFSTASRRTALHALTRVLSSQKDSQDGASVSEDVLSSLALFFEAGSRRACRDEHSWWLVVVLLAALLSAMDIAVCYALLSAVVVPQPACQLKELSTSLAFFYRDTPLLVTATKLFRSLHCEDEEAGMTPAAVSSVLSILCISS